MKIPRKTYRAAYEQAKRVHASNTTFTAALDDLVSKTRVNRNSAADFINGLRKMLNEILARHTGQPLERIEKDTDRDRFMSGQEAVEYGLADKILQHMPHPKAK